MTDQVCHLVAPGLLGPLPNAAQVGQGREQPVTLERWLARGDSQPVPADPDVLLFHLYGLQPPEGDLPTAALCYLADTGQAPDGPTYHADPVHLRPDQDRLLLFDAPAADLTPAETQALLATLNHHLADDGWRLSAPSPGRWYLHLPAALALRTRPLGAVLGRNIDLFLPQGEAATQVRQRLTELQMLLHNHPVNAARQAAGRLAVNGLWLHGGGELPARPTRGYVLSGEPSPLLRGLQQWATGEPVGALHWLGGAQRAVWDADPDAWWQAVQAADRRLRAASPSTLLYPGDGRAYRYGTAQRWRLWHRTRPLVARLLPQDDY